VTNEDEFRALEDGNCDKAVPKVQPRLQAPVTRVAHVIGRLATDDQRTDYLRILVSSLKEQGIESAIFTAECSVEADFEQRAGQIAKTLHESGIPIAFFHAGLKDEITARVASMRPTLIQVLVGHESETEADLFDGRIHLFEKAPQDTRFAGLVKWIPPVSTIQVRLKQSEPITSQSIGLESAGSVSATFGDLHHVSSREFLSVLCEILKRFPKHFHLFAGAGNVRAIRPHLHNEGVLPRVRFLGQVGDVSPLLQVIDLYLVSFPGSDPHSVLEPMGAGKPVVVLRCPESPYTAELMGIGELTARSPADFINIADRLLRNPEYRAQQRQAVLHRFDAEFRPERLGERYKAFLSCFQ